MESSMDIANNKFHKKNQFISIFVLYIAVVGLIRPNYLLSALINLYPTDDAYIYSSGPGGNGSNEYLRVGYYATYGNYRTLIKFNIIGEIPAGSTINSAVLNLRYYSYYGSSDSRNTGAYRVTSDWEEGSVVWNDNYSTYAYDIESVGGSSLAWETWDVTQLVQYWIDGTYSNFGVMLKCTSEGGGSDNLIYLRSNEYSSERPYLQIDYTPPTLNCVPDVEYIQINGQTVSSGGTINIELDNPSSDSFELYLRGENDGTDAAVNGSALNFSIEEFTSATYKNNINVYDNSSDLDVGEYFGYEAVGGDGYADYVMVEGSDDNWSYNESNYMHATIQPGGTGSFHIHYKMALNKSASGQDWVIDPSSSSYLDCISEPSYQITVNVFLTVPTLSDISPNPSYDGTFNLSWSSIPNIDYYELEWDDDQNFSSPFTPLIAYGTSYQQIEQDLGTYYYHVRAKSGSIYSEWSNIQSVSVELAAPTNVQAEGISSTEIEITWDDNSYGANNEDGFYVLVSDDNSDWYNCATLPSNTTEYIHSNLVPGITNYYAVRAFKGTHMSEMSESDAGTTIEYSYSVKVQNRNNGSDEVPESDGLVKLYKAGVFNDQQYTISTNDGTGSGIAAFTNKSSGSDYSCDVYHYEDPETIFGPEYWGSMSDITIPIPPGDDNPAEFMRYMPVQTDIRVFHGTTDITGQDILPGTSLTIKVKVENFGSAIETKVRLLLRKDSESPFFDEISDTDVINGAGGVEYFEFDCTPTEVGSYYAIAGPLVEHKSEWWATDGQYWNEYLKFRVIEDDNIPPQVSATTPADGAVGWSVDQKEILVEFGEDVDGNTVNTNTFLVTLNGINLNGSVTALTGTNYKFTISDDLIHGETYECKLTTGITDLSGNTLDGNANNVEEGSPTDDYIWHFTVETGAVQTRFNPDYFNNCSVKIETPILLEAKLERDNFWFGYPDIEDVEIRFQYYFDASWHDITDDGITTTSLITDKSSDPGVGSGGIGRIYFVPPNSFTNLSKPYSISIRVLFDGNEQYAATQKTATLTITSSITEEPQFMDLYDSTHDPANSIPLILVHGVGSDDSDNADTHYGWIHFLDYFKNVQNANHQFDEFDVYVWRHDTELPVGFNGTTGNARELKYYIDSMFPGKQVVFVVHSRGGLVVRSYANYNNQGDNVLGLITLGTPHHGSPAAIPDWVAYTWMSIFGISPASRNPLNLWMIGKDGQIFDYDNLGWVNLAWDKMDGAIGGVIQDNFPGVSFTNNDFLYISERDFNKTSSVADMTILYSDNYKTRFGTLNELNNNELTNNQNFTNKKTIAYAAFSNDLSTYNFPTVDLLDDFLESETGHTLKLFSQLFLASMSDAISQDHPRYYANDGVVPIQSALFLNISGGIQFCSDDVTNLSLINIDSRKQVKRHRIFSNASGITDHSYLLDTDNIDYWDTLNYDIRSFIPSMEITSPEGGENWQMGSNHNITWNSSGTSGNVKIEYSIDNGSNWTIEESSTIDDGVYEWTVPNAPSTTCLVRVSDVDDGSPTDQSEAVFTISVPVSNLTDFTLSYTTTQTAGTAFPLSVTNAVDQNSDPWSGTFTVSFSGTEDHNAPDGSIPTLANITVTDGSGNADQTLVLAETGVQLSASADGVTETTSAILVNPGALAEFTMTGYPSTIQAGTNFPDPVVVMCYDQYENLKTDYRGDVYFMSTDNQAVLPYTNPSRYTYTELDAGHHSFSGSGFQLNEIGDQTITVTDDVKQKTSSTIVVTSSPNQKPIVSAVTPTSGQYKDDILLTATSSDPDPGDTVEKEKYEYSLDGSTSWTSIGEDDSPADGYAWTSGINDASVWIRAAAYDGTEWGDWYTGQGSFMIDNTAPEFSNWSTNPQDLTDQSTGLFTVTLDILDILSSISQNTPQFAYKIGSDAYSDYADMTQGTGYSWSFNIPEPGGGWSSRSGEVLYYMVSCTDNVGNHQEEEKTDTIQNISLSNVLNLKRIGTTPVIVPGEAGEWDEDRLTIGSIIYKDGQYKMWYHAQSGENRQIGYATSNDGYFWTKYANNPVYNDPNIIYESYPCVIHDGQNYKMYYMAATGTSDIYPIRLATSDDGINWTKYSDNPVLNYNSSNPWEAQRLRVSTIFYDGQTYTMYYDGKPGHSSLPGGGIGIATSTDGVQWVRYPNNPVIPHGETGTFNEFESEVPYVVTEDQNYNMLFVGRRDEGTTRIRTIGYASSDDGFTWSLSEDCPITLDNGLIDRPGPLFNNNGEYSMWYTSEDNIYLACTVNPEIICVTSPDGGEVYQGNSITNINWQSIGTSGNVKIEYSTDNGTNWTEEIASTPDDGTYEWTVPDEASAICLVRVSEIDGPAMDQSNAVFTIQHALITDTVIDADGNVYQTVKIGNQWWMAENLKVTHYRNGDEIPNVINASEWGSLESGAYCNYDNNLPIGEERGRLYNWYAVDDSRNIAPEGWHVASDDDWKELETFLGMSSEQVEMDNVWRGTIEGGLLKEIGTEHWESPNNGATNAYGFTGIPGGRRRENVGTFMFLNTNLITWCSTEANGYGWLRSIYHEFTSIYRHYDYKDNGYSVRCVKDPEQITLTAPNGGQNWQVGDIENITWTSSGTSGNVRIEYSTDNGVNWTEEIASTPDDEIYEWTVPNRPSTTCFVRISDTDGSPVDQSNGVFCIVEHYPVVSVITPQYGGNNGMIDNLDIIGLYFQNSATVKLTRSGFEDLDGINVSVIDSTKITCSFNLLNLTPGLWNVVITNPGGLNSGSSGNEMFTVLDVQNNPILIDSLALIALYDSTDGSNWTNKTNWFNGSVKTWYGVTIDSGRVIQINLKSNNLSGSLPSDISQINKLKYLNLGLNHLSGEIPDRIGNLQFLESLSLGNNQFTGSIPSTFGNLTNLWFLYLAHNQLTGTIPAEIGDMTSLQNLILFVNQLSGELPLSIGNLSNLQVFHIYANNFTGAIPDTICSLDNLSSVYLFNNEFVDLPDMSEMSNLSTLSVSANKLSFEDLEPNMAIDNFTYSSQDSVGIKYDTAAVLGWPFTLFASVGGRANIYQWYKDGEAISSDENLRIETVNENDAGTYTCNITNTIVPDLTLYKRSIIVSTTTPTIYEETQPVSIETTAEFNESSQNGDGHPVDVTFTTFTGAGDVTVIQTNAPPSISPCQSVCNFHWNIANDTEITNFNVNITFHYTEDDVSGYTETGAFMGIAKFNESTNTWIWLGGTVDAGANTVTVPGVTSFSTFALYRRIFGDVTGDGYVNAADLQRLGDCWHETNSGEFTEGCDARFFNYNKNTDGGNQIIDAADLQVFGDCWHNGQN